MSSAFARKVIYGRPLIARNVSGGEMTNRTPPRDIQRIACVLFAMVLYTAVYYQSGSFIRNWLVPLL
jgi:hypothetical protein